MRFLKTINVFIGVIVLMISGCASPTSPSGGPPDESPPEITKTVPESGTTQFNQRVIELHFNEFVERNSLPRALTLAPNLGVDYSLDWGRKSVEIVMNKPLPDSTTFIISVGTELEDVHGNALGSPIKIALSTGPVIDKGKLVGELKRAESGRVESGMKVMLYRKPMDLTTPADYITETDTGGHISFPYLGKGTYKAFWVDDRNRNRIWDKSSERAQPFPTEFVELKKGETDSLGTLFVHNPDTTRPKLVGIGLFTRQRLRFRFSESVRIDSLRDINILDSAMNPYGKAYPLYQPDKEDYVVFAHSTQPLLPQSSYHVRFKGLTDLNGNPLRSVKKQPFTGTSQKDTVRQRIIAFDSGEGIYRNEPLVVTYSKPITESIIRDSIRVIEGQTQHKKWENITLRHNKLSVAPDTVWKKGVSYQLMVWNPKLKGFKTFETTIWHPSDLGKVHFIRADTTDSLSYNLQLKSSDERIVRRQNFVRETTISKLPPMRYIVKVYQDQDGDNRWDPGSVDPYKSPEPYFIKPEIPVQPGFTSDLTIQFDY